MTIEPTILWNILLSLIIVPFGWAFNKMFQEVKRLQILLNRTREELATSYARKDDVKSDIKGVMDALHRLEDKIDKVLSK
tara:strand:- start:647 stop:886 length:240 start_codon:yes stop_codon:yes gene_type:complete